MDDGNSDGGDNNLMTELLLEVRKDVKNTNKKLDEHREETLKWFYESKNRLDKYNQELELHIEGVETLKQLHLDNLQRIEDQAERLDTIEKPGKVMKFLGNKTVKVVTVVSTFVGLAVATLRLMNLL